MGGCIMKLLETLIMKTTHSLFQTGDAPKQFHIYHDLEMKTTQTYNAASESRAHFPLAETAN